MTNHPFINIQEIDAAAFQAASPPSVHMLTMRMNGNLPSMSFSQVPPQHGFASFDELEDHVLGYYLSNSPGVQTENLQGGALGFVIVRAASKIAQLTRRGPGNRLIVNPDDLSQFINHVNVGTGSMFMTVPDGATHGRTQHVGLLANSLDVWTHPGVPSGSHVVMYSGRGDNPAVAVETHTGWHLALLPQGNYAESKDYAIIVR